MLNDWYDFEKVQELYNANSRKYVSLVKKWHDAKESKNEKDMKKALKAISNHKRQSEILKTKAEKCGYDWY